MPKVAAFQAKAPAFQPVARPRLSSFILSDPRCRLLPCRGACFLLAPRRSMPLEIPDCRQDTDDREQPKSLGDEAKLHVKTLEAEYRKQDEKHDCERDKIANDEANLPGRIPGVRKVAVRHVSALFRSVASRPVGDERQQDEHQGERKHRHDFERIHHDAASSARRPPSGMHTAVVLKADQPLRRRYQPFTRLPVRPCPPPRQQSFGFDGEFGAVSELADRGDLGHQPLALVDDGSGLPPGRRHGLAFGGAALASGHVESPKWRSCAATLPTGAVNDPAATVSLCVNSV